MRMGERFSARDIQSALTAVCFKQSAELFQNILRFCPILKGAVILLIAMLTAQVTAVRDMPLEGEIRIVKGFHCQKEELPPLPQPPQLEQLEPLEQLEQLEPLEQLEQLLPLLLPLEMEIEGGGRCLVVCATK